MPRKIRQLMTELEKQDLKIGEVKAAIETTDTSELELKSLFLGKLVMMPSTTKRWT